MKSEEAVGDAIRRVSGHEAVRVGTQDRSNRRRRYCSRASAFRAAVAAAEACLSIISSRQAGKNVIRLLFIIIIQTCTVEIQKDKVVLFYNYRYASSVKKHREATTVQTRHHI